MQDNHIIYIEYKTERKKLDGANIIWYDINSGEKKVIYQLEPRASCVIINNPDSNYIMIRIDQINSTSKLVTINPEDSSQTIIASSNNMKSNFRLNSKMCCDDGCIWSEYTGNAINPYQLSIMDSFEKTKITTRQSTYYSCMFISKKFASWIESIDSKNQKLCIIKRGMQ